MCLYVYANIWVSFTIKTFLHLSHSRPYHRTSRHRLDGLWIFWLTQEHPSYRYHTPCQGYALSKTVGEKRLQSIKWLVPVLWEKTQHCFRPFFGDSAIVSQEVVENWLDKFPELCKGYHTKDRFNCDETGLGWRTLPSKSSIHSSEEREICIYSPLMLLGLR